MNQPHRLAIVAHRPAVRSTVEDQVFAALLDLGGSAHVDDIVRRVTLQRRGRGLVGGPPVRLLVESALHHMRSPDDQPHTGDGVRVYRPFGAASRRWAVCRDHAVNSNAPVARRLRLALIQD